MWLEIGDIPRGFFWYMAGRTCSAYDLIGGFPHSHWIIELNLEG